jgi:hypothetical protein
MRRERICFKTRDRLSTSLAVYKVYPRLTAAHKRKIMTRYKDGDRFLLNAEAHANSVSELG